MHSVLVTGGAGFIGSRLCRRLESLASTALVLDHRKLHEKVITLDLASRKSVADAFSMGVFDQKIDIVVHLASRLIGYDNSRDTSVLHDNIYMAENVAYIAEMLEVRKIVHASTMAVYPNQTGTYREDAPTVTSRNSECLYGLSKICCEQLLDFFMSNHSVKTVHLRFAQVYGEGMRSDRVMTHMERELEHNNSITVYGNGERISNFMTVDNAVDAICRFIRNDADGIFNVGGEQLSYLEVAQRITEHKGNADSKIKILPEGCKEKVVLDCSKYQAFVERHKDEI